MGNYEEGMVQARIETFTRRYGQVMSEFNGLKDHIARLSPEIEWSASRVADDIAQDTEVIGRPEGKRIAAELANMRALVAKIKL